MKNIISKTTLALLLPLSFSVNALASMPGHFVAGAEIGYINRTGDLVSDNFFLAGIPIAGEYHDRLNNDSTLYGAFVGYQFLCKCVLFGVEAYANFADDDHVQTTAIPLLNTSAFANVSTQKDALYGVSARLGYKVSPCFLPYLRIGAQGGEDKYFITYTGLATLPLFDHFQDKKTHWNWLLGVGLEVPFFSTRTSLRLEYDYVPAQKINYIDTQLPVLAEHHYNPHSHIVKLQWAWNFR